MSPEIRTIIDIAKEAGNITHKYWRQELTVEYKKNEFDPVTIADKESDAYLRKTLKYTFPNSQILSEESSERPNHYDGQVWMVDPIDGTKGFVAGRPGYTIIIGLLDDGKPKLGVVYQPETNTIYYGETGKGSYKVVDGIKTRLFVSSENSIELARLVGRIAHPDDVREVEKNVLALGFKEIIPDDSIVTKIGKVAEGSAEAFVHTNLLACKWDTLAPEVILKEAGGIITDLYGEPLDYTQKEVGWKHYFIATGSSQLHELIISAMKDKF